jgi:hypothetical protein
MWTVSYVFWTMLASDPRIACRRAPQRSDCDVQLPYVAAIWRMPLPTPSRALFNICATSWIGCPPDFEALDVRSAMVSSSSDVLLRRQASKMSSLGDAP